MSQRQAQLVRYAKKNNTLLGKWTSDSGFVAYTIENAEDAIPFGSYQAYWRFSSKHKCNLYGLKDVPGRTDIEIHSANLAEQLLGCIAPGDAVAFFAQDSISKGVPIETVVGVTNSVATLYKLEIDMRDGKLQQVPFTLEIKNA